MNLERFRHRKAITYKQAGVIVIGLHVIVFIGLSEVSKLRASWRKADRDKMWAEKASAPKASTWPEKRPAPMVVARPKPIIKELVIPPSVPEKIADEVVSCWNNTKQLTSYLSSSCQEAYKVTQKNAKTLQQVAKQTSSFVDNKLQASQYRNPKPLPTPCKRSLSLTQPKSVPKSTPQVVYSKTTTRSNGNRATQEEFTETRTTIPRSTVQRVQQRFQQYQDTPTIEEEIIRNEQVVYMEDRNTGRWVRVRVAEPSNYNNFQ